MGVDFLGVAGPARSVPIGPPSPLEGDSKGFKTHHPLLSCLRKLMVEHVRDGLGVDRARTVIVCVPLSLRRYPQKAIGDDPESKSMLPCYSTKENRHIIIRERATG